MTSKKRDKQEDADDESSWEIVQVLTQRVNAERWAVANTVALLHKENTVPFIARYRKEQTNNMSVDMIREVKENYEELQAVQAKSASVIKAVDKLGKLTGKLRSALKATQNLREIEYLYAPYKAGSKRSLAERAREAGLEPLALRILKQPRNADLQSAVKPGQEGLKSLEEVEKGIQHIIADIIAKDKETLDSIRNMCQHANVTIVTKSKSQTTSKNEKEKKFDPGQSKRDANLQKFDLYHDFTVSVRTIKPHQVLAINRGENLNVLTVKVNLPDHVKNSFVTGCHRKMSMVMSSPFQKLMDTSIEDAYRRLISPLLTRQIRSDLTKNAQKASVEVFGANLNRLLLTPPVRGQVVLGVDPGFRNGCKYAVIGPSGRVMHTGVWYMHVHQKAKEVQNIRAVVKKYQCETVAIGNGTACRETEVMFSEQIKQESFHPLRVKYCVVNESGASIYSASPLAQQEMPDLDVTLRGAVSIARRLQDPLAELVKIEPRHIGVGMYQHDLSDAVLNTALDSVVEECVSFVGVDLNVGSEMLLRRVAGLSSSLAKKIVEWREANGNFVSRLQLCGIKGLGPKTFEQCAGFVRIVPETRGTVAKQETHEEGPTTSTGKRKRQPAKTTAKKMKFDPAAVVPDNLDMTCVHPESYHIANQLLEIVDVSKVFIGQPPLIKALKEFTKRNEMSDLAKRLKTGEPTLQLIIDGLLQPLGHDIREEFEKPLFKQGVMSLSDLKTGTVVTGRVTNTTHFGAFTDIGVGRDALIHCSNIRPSLLQGKKTLELGDKVEVVVQRIELERQRIGLRLLRLL